MVTGWEGVAEYYATMGGHTPDVDPAASPWQSKPRSSLFTCGECQVREFATVPDIYTAYVCWCCGSDEHTTPRPSPRPEPAGEETH